MFYIFGISPHPKLFSENFVGPHPKLFVILTPNFVLKYGLPFFLKRKYLFLYLPSGCNILNDLPIAFSPFSLYIVRALNLLPIGFFLF